MIKRIEQLCSEFDERIDRVGVGMARHWWAARLAEIEGENERLRTALSSLLEEYEDRQAQFGDYYLWDKHEDGAVIEEARQALNAETNADEP